MTDRFRVPQNVHARQFDDEMVVLHLGVGQYYSLDAVGSAIWTQLTTGKTTSEAIVTILAEFEVDEATAKSDVQRLTDELVAAGLLEPER